MRNLWVALLSVQGLASYFTGKIAPTERVIFFPTAATQWNSTHWHVPIHGWIFEPEENSKKRAVFRSLLRRVLKVKSGTLEKYILDRRIKPFVVGNERWKRPRINLNGKEYTMNWSGKNGHFQTLLILPHNELFDGQESVDNQIRPLTYFATSSDNSRKHEGKVHLVPPKGITILSDIDDTIKITNVMNKKEMLRNTFMREFQPVPGMAEVYSEWCSSQSGENHDHSIHLHFLSSSMYQLYEDLETFRSDAGFPPATYSLKTVRPKNARQTVQILLEDALEFKRRALTKVLKAFPRRHFVLVGDTGEKDPQVYASIAKDYPFQILGIYLRSVQRSEEDPVVERVEQIMNDYGIDKGLWTVFEDASELRTVNLRQLPLNR